MNPLYQGQHPCLGLENILIEGNKEVNPTFEVTFPKVQLFYLVVGLARYPALLQFWMRVCLVFTLQGIMSNENFSDSETLPEVMENELSLNEGRLTGYLVKERNMELNIVACLQNSIKGISPNLDFIHDTTA